MTFDERKRASEKLNETYRRFSDEDYVQTKKDYRELLQLPAFRRVLIGILKRARVFGSISMDTTDTNTVMKAIGWRELGVDIYCTANQADGLMVLKAIAERTAIERERKERLENANEKVRGNDNG